MTLASPEIDQQQPPLPAPPAEQPVFAATTPRRRRALRTLAIAATAIATAWLIALVLGVFGFDALPGISLPGEQQASGAGGAPAGAPASHRRAGRLTGAAAASLPTQAKTTELRHEIARRASRADRQRRSARTRGGGHASTRSPSSPASPGSPASAATPQAPASAATPVGNTTGRPAAPGDRRSPSATPGGHSGTATAPATTTTTTSHGHSADAPGTNR